MFSWVWPQPSRRKRPLASIAPYLRPIASIWLDHPSAANHLASIVSSSDRPGPFLSELSATVPRIRRSLGLALLRTSLQKVAPAAPTADLLLSVNRDLPNPDPHRTPPFFHPGHRDEALRVHGPFKDRLVITHRTRYSGRTGCLSAHPSAPPLAKSILTDLIDIFWASLAQAETGHATLR